MSSGSLCPPHAFLLRFRTRFWQEEIVSFKRTPSLNDDNTKNKKAGQWTPVNWVTMGQEVWLN